MKLGRGGGSIAHEPLKVLEKLDPSLLELIKRSSDFALSDGALPRKFKLLIAMALDASKGAEVGVRALAKRTPRSGALLWDFKYLFSCICIRIRHFPFSTLNLIIFVLCL
jgi:hypothetical protein